jgi:hypothetical protein
MNNRIRNERVAPRSTVGLSAILLAFGLVTSGGGALATPQSFNYHGTPLLTGGVSEEERDAMRSEIAPYNVWLVFVERDTGNYLAGVKVSVVDDKENAVVDTVADGPWLLAQLPPGHYKVRTSDGQEQAITAGAGTRPMTILRLPRQP